jgi:hypothetical protein
MADTPDKPDPDAGALNPRLHQGVDREYSEAQHGSTPMDSVSVKPSGPAIWPVIWAIATIGLILLTLWLVFG